MHPESPEGRSGDDIRTRLRRALGEGIRGRDTSAVPVLRTALGAIGNILQYGS